MLSQSDLNYFKNTFILDIRSINLAHVTQAFKRNDVPSIGASLTKYWEQKKLMAPGCEPKFVKE